MLNGAIIRIALRYGAGFLVARGLMGADDASMLSNDPDVQMVIEVGVGALTSVATESFYYLAHKFGWAL